MAARLLVLALLAGASLAACGDDDGGGAGGNGGTTSSGYPVAWLRAIPARGGRALRIGYETDPCTRARRARVEEDDKVTVTLLDPRRDPHEACIQLAKPGCATVTLAEPLRGREVVDGAPDTLPPRVREQDRRPFRLFGRCRPVPAAG